MKQKNKLNTKEIIAGTAITITLFFLTLLATFLPQETLFEQIAKTSAITLNLWGFLRLLNFFVWPFYQTCFKKSPPTIIQKLTGFLLAAIATLYVITIVFGQPATYVLSAFGFLGVGLTIALQNPILDIFAGLILDIEYSFKRGEWLWLPPELSGDEGVIGQVVTKSLRTTTFATGYGYKQLTIPNGALLRSSLTNLNRPKGYFLDTIILGLDFDLSLTRARRILYAALGKVPGLKEHIEECKVYAESTDSGGVNFRIAYPLKNPPEGPDLRHSILTAVTDELFHCGLKLSESLGEYAISGVAPIERKPPLGFKDLAVKISLFSEFSAAELAHLDEVLQPVSFSKGELIVKEGAPGDSLFVIGEGVVKIHKEVENADGKKIQKYLTHLNAWDYFGDRALLLGEKRSASVSAETDVIVFEIPKKLLAPLLKKRPALAKKLSHVMASREIETSSLLKEHAKDLEGQKEAKAHELLKEIKSFFGL